MSLELPKESMIPLMPCASYADMVAFYTALGFTVTHQQQEPYIYIAVIELIPPSPAFLAQ